MQETAVFFVIELVSVEDPAGLKTYVQRASELIGPLGGELVAQGGIPIRRDSDRSSAGRHEHRLEDIRRLDRRRAHKLFSPYHLSFSAIEPRFPRIFALLGAPNLCHGDGNTTSQ
jgi:hypothetical protein